MELITRALPTQIKWNLLGLKESSYIIFLEKFQGKGI